MAKEKLSADEKFEKIDFDLFEALTAIDKKDYSYYDRLTPEQQKKFVPFMMLHWISAIKGSEGLSRYYVMSTNEYANKYLFNENVIKHPKLQWLMLCSASPGMGKQFHQWIPHIRERISKLKESPKTKEIKDYYKKIYPKSSDSDLNLVTDVFVDNHRKKMYMARATPPPDHRWSAPRAPPALSCCRRLQGPAWSCRRAGLPWRLHQSGTS
jgi:hypothetical protein